MSLLRTTILNIDYLMELLESMKKYKSLSTYHKMSIIILLNLEIELHNKFIDNTITINSEDFDWRYDYHRLLYNDTEYYGFGVVTKINGLDYAYVSDCNDDNYRVIITPNNKTSMPYICGKKRKGMIEVPYLFGVLNDNGYLIDGHKGIFYIPKGLITVHPCKLRN